MNPTPSSPFGNAQQPFLSRSTVHWVPVRRLVVDGKSASDPKQGNLGNCYFIAALSAIASACPERLQWTKQPEAHALRFTFFRDGNSSTVDVEQDVPEYAEANLPRYGSSTQKGEGWPALYEKAYAKWKNGETDDEPDYQAIAGGNPAVTLGELTGLTVEKHRCSEFDEEELLNLIKSEAPQRRLEKPTVAWTFANESAAELQPVLYDNSNLLVAHAYTVLGWEETTGDAWVILRNPLARRDVSHPSIATGHRMLLNSTAWKTEAQKDEGMFALEVSVFRRYFNKLAMAA